MSLDAGSAQIEINGRRGSESNTPRPVEQADGGFEDRGGHQAPITLQNAEGGVRIAAHANRHSAFRVSHSAFVRVTASPWPP